MSNRMLLREAEGSNSLSIGSVRRSQRGDAVLRFWEVSPSCRVGTLSSLNQKGRPCVIHDGLYLRHTRWPLLPIGSKYYRKAQEVLAGFSKKLLERSQNEESDALLPWHGGHPNTSVVMFSYQLRAYAASRTRRDVGASLGLTPPAPFTPTISPSSTRYTPATEIAWSGATKL